jgi:hypothetical protein
MKFIKLDGRHCLYKKGYQWAFRFPSVYNANTTKVAIMVREAEPYFLWNHTHTSARDKWSKRPYFVGFKNEKTAVYVLLKL